MIRGFAGTFLTLALISGCATAPVPDRTPRPFKKSDLQNQKQQKQDAFKSFKVEKTDGTKTVVAGESYEPFETIPYFRDSGDIEATDKMQEAWRLENHGQLVGGLCMLTGGVLGGLLQMGAIGGGDHSGGPDMLPGLSFIPGAAAGVVVVGLSYWPIYHYTFGLPAQKKVEEAGESFNRFLSHELDLEISPAQNGVGTSIKLIY